MPTISVRYSGGYVKVNLTLQEKLRDLRDERKLKLQEVADLTGIPLATISRIESNDDNRECLDFSVIGIS